MKLYYLFTLTFILSTHSFALSFIIPENGNTLIGDDSVVVATQEDTLIDIARRENLGFDEIVNANPAIDPWLPKAGTRVLIPHRYLLPNTPHEGIVVNVAEKRLYYFPPTTEELAIVETFPISIGRSDWSTPIVNTTIVRKMENPQWRPPQSIKEEHALEGDVLPDVIAAGPDNPLGLYALYLGIPSYLIHGTNKEYGIGMQVTHGCMRMYPEDIEHLFNSVNIGTPVYIVNQPFKVGWFNDTLYLEAHPFLEGSEPEIMNDKMPLVELILSMLHEHPYYPVDWSTVEIIRVEASGIPVAIGPEKKAPVYLYNNNTED
jgi:L,D-transpeptidase ErfK/SrfK